MVRHGSYTKNMEDGTPTASVLSLLLLPSSPSSSFPPLPPPPSLLSLLLLPSSSSPSYLSPPSLLSGRFRGRGRGGGGTSFSMNNDIMHMAIYAAKVDQSTIHYTVLTNLQACIVPPSLPPSLLPSFSPSLPPPPHTSLP